VLVGGPEVEVRVVLGEARDRQRADVLDRHHGVGQAVDRVLPLK
jgi:hypothetical protein